jgi:hypothetical protein
VEAPARRRRALDGEVVAAGRVEADPGPPGGDPVVVGVGEAGDLRDATLVVDVESGVAPAFLVRGEGPCVAVVVVGVGGLPVWCKHITKFSKRKEESRVILYHSNFH